MANVRDSAWAANVRNGSGGAGHPFLAGTEDARDYQVHPKPLGTVILRGECGH